MSFSGREILKQQNLRLPLTIAAATIHCVILRERVNDGPSLYGVDDGSWDSQLPNAGLLTFCFPMCPGLPSHFHSEPRDPDLSRKPRETEGKRIRFLERTMVEKNGEPTPWTIFNLDPQKAPKSKRFMFGLRDNSGFGAPICRGLLSEFLQLHLWRLVRMAV